MSRKQTALVVCPGRGTYNKPDLGYLSRHHSRQTDMLAIVEAERERLSQSSLKSLDSAVRYSVATHTRGDNASLLIHACAMGDFNAIDRDKFEIVAVTGNSMGWYISLACADAAAPSQAARIVNTMGTYMQESLIGGQLVYPLLDDDWQPVSGRRAKIEMHMTEINEMADAQIGVSIELGGMLVLAGNEKGLNAISGRLAVIDRFPMMLANHAGFHTNLQQPVSERGLAALPADMFSKPTIPMIDGRGHIWQSASTDIQALHAYTLGDQVTETYDFTRAVQVGVREFAPDSIIILGPGTTLGGAVAQSLIGINWQGLSSKTDFIKRQEASPIVLSLGREDQRAAVVS